MNTIIEKYVSVWNSNAISDLEEVFSETSTYWDATQAGKALEVLTSSIATTYAAFPDIVFEMVALVAARENQYFLEWQMTGTHTGAFLGHPPTGKKINLRGLDAIQVESDKIITIRSFYDSSLFSQQLGLS
ncbi:MAG: ester cyclase [Bacteroidota bacterium]